MPRLLSAVPAMLALLGNLSIAIAQTVDLSADDIVRQLKPPPATQAVRSLAGQDSSRGITVEGDYPKAAQPSVDMHIEFEYDKSSLTNDGILSLKALGAALQSPDLQSFAFEIVGHTDAKGDDVYNIELSNRRAAAVKAHLVQFYNIAESKLATQGKGETELLDQTRPEDGINRRVQIRTVVTK